MKMLHDYKARDNDSSLKGHQCTTFQGNEPHLHLPKNDTRLSRSSTFPAHTLLKASVGDFVFLLWPICIKCTHSTNLREVSAMKIITENITIPVPKVLCALNMNGKSYIVMKRVRGNKLSRTWHDWSKILKKIILAQLGEYFEQLRKIPSPPSGVITTSILSKLPYLVNHVIFYGSRLVAHLQSLRTCMRIFYME